MKIIKNNNRMIKRMYGYDMKDDATSVVSASLNEGSALKSVANVFSIEIEKTNDGCDRIKVLYNEYGKTKEKLQISSYQRNKSELENENQLLSTYSEVSSMLDVREIKCSDFLDEVKARLLNDVRYAYKRFSIVSSKNSRHSVRIYRVYAIIIATLSIMNEMDFKLPILMKLGREREGLTLQIEIKLSGKEVTRREELLKKSINEARLIYLNALCSQDEINNGLYLEGRRIVLRYIIDEVPSEKFKLYSKASDEDRFFKKYMDIFNGVINDIGAEKEEE